MANNINENIEIDTKIENIIKKMKNNNFRIWIQDEFWTTYDYEKKEDTFYEWFMIKNTFSYLTEEKMKKKIKTLLKKYQYRVDSDKSMIIFE